MPSMVAILVCKLSNTSTYSLGAVFGLVL
ncbi:uncharacterized protein FFB20_11012 [Fusarium fujikuroi]|nr:uncharacterized protein FFB20_11012 [Fusarium fujikuroi]SCO24276.1 uncharacterized protein FFE2_15907 [Fusarium fujikuroi]SCO25584.1 uncharacterized protein FFC1_15603 [Fusarium fujikuroi]